ncbi:hypothetical protein ABI59_01550 [Acidobacteria bacterium Mor1]|nr:hypothetical protein ABI59_01550 [Acidobacteria bacterium Mor1]
MLRAEKVKHVEALNESFSQTPHVILASFTKLTVNEVNELRRKVREAGGTYQVLQNRLSKRAAQGTALEHIADKFSGPCAVARHPEDPVGLAKVVSQFAKDHPSLELVAGVVDSKEVLDQEGVKTLATMPGLPELRAKLVGLLNTPATTLVRLLNTPGGQIARAIDANREKQGGAAE